MSDDGKSVKSLGYINNLHPDEHADLHKTIEEIVGSYIPLFERALTDSIYENYMVPHRVSSEYDYEDPDSPRPNDDEFENWEKYKEACDEWDEKRIIHVPDIARNYLPGSLEKRKIWYGLAGKTIQVIVKLANIYLVGLITQMHRS